MKRFTLSLIGLLCVSACSGAAVEIRNSNSKVIGVIEAQGTQTATIKNTAGETRGKVRGTVIRDDSGKHVGTIAEKDGHTVISDEKDNAVGSVDGNKCYGKGQEVLGTVSGEADSSAIAAACLLFFLQ
jgi:hypothetical protein